MIFLPAAIRVDRARRPKAGAPHRGLDLPLLVVEAALVLVIFPALLLLFVLVGGVMAAEWLVRRAHEAIRRNARRLGRVVRNLR